MSAQETINGQPVTEEQIAAWADEAERGYDVAALKKRGRGRPGRGAMPTQVVALRLTTDELAAIDARAEIDRKTIADNQLALTEDRERLDRQLELAARIVEESGR